LQASIDAADHERLQNKDKQEDAHRASVRAAKEAKKAEAAAEAAAEAERRKKKRVVLLPAAPRGLKGEGTLICCGALWTPHLHLPLPRYGPLTRGPLSSKR